MPFRSPLDLDACIATLLTPSASTGSPPLLSETVLAALTALAKSVLMRQPNIVPIAAPATVVGDIHGQFHDLLEIFKIGGAPPDTNYIFLGDFVDRGYFSVEVVTLLTLYKCRYPDRFLLIRGNHESRAITQTYGFYAECMRKYPHAASAVWKHFTDMFDYIPLAAVIDNSILCVHGGLSPSVITLDQIRVLDRFREVPHEGPMADLVWSDPDADKDDFVMSPRGAGYYFGASVVARFLHVNNLEHILRAHQLCMDGYNVLFNDTLSTVWSAPNYVSRCGNKASILEVDASLRRCFNVFDAAPESARAMEKQGSSENKPVQYFL